MVKTQRWCWPLLQSDGIIPTILSLFKRTKAPEDGTNEASWKCQALVTGMKILKRLSAEENHAQEIRCLGGQDLLITLLAPWGCGADHACSFPHAWISTHAMLCMGNLALPCGRPISRSVAVLADGSWLEPVIRRAMETVMRVMLRLQTYMESLVAGITTLTHLIQLQTTDLQDPTWPSWTQGLLDSLSPLLHEHPSDTTGSCPKGMASLLKGRLQCVETCLRHEMDQNGDKQKLKLLQNMSARLLDMLSPSWLGAYQRCANSEAQMAVSALRTRTQPLPRVHRNPAYNQRRPGRERHQGSTAGGNGHECAH